MSNGIVQYIGRSKNLQQRWLNHHRCGNLTTDCHIAWLEINNPKLLPEVEKALIAWFNPALNGSGEHKKIKPSKSMMPLYLDDEVKEDLKKLAKADGRSMSKFIESVLKELASKARKLGRIE